MNFLKFIFKSLWYFRKQQLALLAGTALSTAILTGSLIIGDSVRHSLKDLVNYRLGQTKYAMNTGDRYVSPELAVRLSDRLNVNSATVLQIPAIAINPDQNLRINSVQVIGIDSNFNHFAESALPDLADDEVVISENTAQRLNMGVGQEILLRIENISVIPLNSPFASQEQSSVSMRLKVKSIAGKNDLGRYSLRSDQKAPYNVFVSQKMLAENMNIKGLVNTILLSERHEIPLSQDEIQIALKKEWKLQDAGLEIKKSDNVPGLELVSNRIFIEENIISAIDGLNTDYQSVLTYLVNTLSSGVKNTPYSFVAALDNAEITRDLKENEIVINQWLADDLNVKKGDSLHLDYFIIGPFRKLQEVSSKFIIKEIVPLQNMQSLMPSYPGLSDAGHCRDWKAGVPINLDRIRDKDEAYWNVYKGTPKAFISLQSGKKIWKNQFGELTSVRFKSPAKDSLGLGSGIISKLNPADFNLIFQPVYDQGIAATINAVDFGELFLSLGFFVIVAAVLLTMLIHGLNMESRSIETGVLMGLGFNHKSILRIRLTESMIIIFIGSLAGALAGILYNYLLLAGLNSVWNEVVRTNMISVFISAQSLIAGSISGIIISMIPVVLLTNKKLKQSITILVKNSSEDIKSGQRQLKSTTIFFLASGLFLLLILLTMAFLTGNGSKPGFFLGSGAMVLITGLLFIRFLFEKHLASGSKLTGINNLAINNIAKNKFRNLATIALLALGVFVIIITAANRKSYSGDESMNQSGTGGYLFWAETSLPVIYNLGTDDGKAKLGLDKEKLTADVHFVQFHSLAGDDASCLNLNQVQKPRILGVDALTFNERNSFSFASVLEGFDNKNPWLELTKPTKNGLIPAVADQTVLTWGLKKSVGDTLKYLNEEGKVIEFLIIGGLSNSVFQGNLLIADSIFVRNFPSVSGSKVMLIDAPSDKKEEISKYLSENLQDLGIDLSEADVRLAEFNSVTNTYLSVFMALGGLGVLIGTIGLGIILIRNMLGRKSELALLQSVGYNKKQIFQLIFKENIILLISGFGIGALAAFIGILPALMTPVSEFPAIFLTALLMIILLNGLAWIYFPTREIMKWNLIRALQDE